MKPYIDIVDEIKASEMTKMNFMEQFYESLQISKKCVHLQHGNVMPKGNGFYELGIQPSLNAFFFSQEDPKAEGCSSTRSAVFFTRI